MNKFLERHPALMAILMLVAGFLTAGILMPPAFWLLKPWWDYWK